MNADVAVARPLRAALQREWLLLVFAAVGVALAWIDPQPASAYRRWLHVPSLAGLTGLLIAIQAIGDSGLVQRAAAKLLLRMRSVRGVGLLMVAAAALLSMVLTNDVSLFLIVPPTLALGGLCRLPVGRVVVLEALAVNAGSSLSPIGNPQNLLLWQRAGVSFVGFMWAMLPAASVMCALVAGLAWCWLPAEQITLAAGALEAERVRRPLAALGVVALVGMVVTLEAGRAVVGLGAVLVAFGLLARGSLRRADWLLLSTLAVIFVALGHAGALPPVRGALERLDLSRPLVAYVAGIGLSQVISNVPATVLLMERVHDPLTLAVAVIVGGFGLAIGSLANLIALRLARLPHGVRLLHRVSVPFLLVCAPLVYLSWRWLG